jgi:hypothetical protein
MRPVIATHLCVVGAFLLHHCLAVCYVTHNLLEPLVVFANNLHRSGRFNLNFFLGGSLLDRLGVH